MNHIMVICDSSENYGRHLAEFINNKKGFPYIARAVGRSELECSLKDSYTDLLLIDEQYRYEDAWMQFAKQVIYLNKGGLSIDEQTREDTIFKYQSAENIVREVLSLLSTGAGIGIVSRKQKLKVIGLFSPVHRLGQTTLALTIGQVVSRHSRGLYLNLEPMAGLDRLYGDDLKGDLSDLICNSQRDVMDLQAYIGSIATEMGSLSLIAPMRNSEDLKSITPLEWRALISSIEARTDYEYLILDISESINGLMELLGMCDRIYMCVTDDVAARAKESQFMTGLGLVGQSDLQERMVRCHLPDIGEETDLGQIIRGELGSYADRLIEEWKNGSRQQGL